MGILITDLYLVIFTPAMDLDEFLKTMSGSESYFDVADILNTVDSCFQNVVPVIIQLR